MGRSRSTHHLFDSILGPAAVGEAKTLHGTMDLAVLFPWKLVLFYGSVDLQTKRRYITVVHLHIEGMLSSADTPTDSTWMLVKKTRPVAPFHGRYSYP